MADEVVSDAVQVFGGNGYAKEYEVEHIYRDVKAGTLYEGTSEVLRNTIGKTMFDEL
jgi:alkylation response protein AidB-like acyl-CoA dehydrogenase